MNSLVQHVARLIAVDYCRLSIVSNPDGWLSRETMRSLLKAEHGLEIVTGSNLDLRIHYELRGRSASEERFVYITQNIDAILPDMLNHCNRCQFSIGDVFPFFGDKALLQEQSFDVLAAAHKQFSRRRVSMADARREIENVKQEMHNTHEMSIEKFNERFAALELDWTDMKSTIDAVSGIFVDVVQAGMLSGYQEQFDRINESFQQWIDSSYFMQQNSSSLLHAPCVNKVLPFIASRHSSADKVALVVVDGLAYWQYAILRDELRESQIDFNDDITLSWLPSITQLSRQALFRGDVPHSDYTQSPSQESKLWREYWTSRGVGTSQIQSIYDSDEFAVNDGVTRLAVVTVEMDDKMHTAYDYLDLLALTRNWAPRFAQRITAMKEMGFTIYLTTDHGSKLSHGWRALMPVEKVFLYHDGSRGKRHLIYSNSNEQMNFYYKAHDEVTLLKHDNWLCIRGNECFARPSLSAITHGGCSVSEVVIPFITI